MRILSFRKLVTSTLTGILVVAGLTFTATPSQATPFLGDISGPKASGAKVVATSAGTFVAAWINTSVDVSDRTVKVSTSADGSSWTAPVSISQTVTNVNDVVGHLDVAVTKNDKVVVIWSVTRQNQQQPYGGSIYSATYSGSTWSSPVVIFQGSVGVTAAYEPKLAASSTTDDALMAVWVVQTVSTRYNHVNAAVTTDAGGTWTDIESPSSTAANANASEPLTDPQIIHVCDATPACNYAVVWRQATVPLYQEDAMIDTSFIWAATILDSVSNTSTHWTRSSSSISNTTNFSSTPRLSSPKTGYVLVTWKNTDASNRRTLQSVTSNNLGASFGSITDIDVTAPAGSTQGPTDFSIVTSDKPNGKSIISYNYGTAAGTRVTKVAFGNTSGTTTTWMVNTTPISAAASLVSGTGVKLVNAGANVVAIWSDKIASQTSEQIYKSVYDSSIPAWSTPTVVSDTAAVGSEPMRFPAMFPGIAVGAGSDPVLITTWMRTDILATGSGTATTLGSAVRAVATPAAPGTPGTPTAVAGNGSATVTVVAPSSGGTPTSYTVTSSPGGYTCTVTSPATSCVVNGLTNGTSYTFTTTATNSGGTSASSGPSASVTPVAPVSAPGTPGTPTAVAGNGSVTVTVVAPTSGGTPTSYTVTSSPGGLTCTVTPPATSCEVTGLTNGTSYTFVTTATNSGGTSSSSASSSSVTPSASSSSGSSSGGSGATGGSAPATSTPSNASGGASSNLGAVTPSTTPSQGSSTTTVNGSSVPTSTSSNVASGSVTTTSGGVNGGSVTYSSTNGGSTQPLSVNNSLSTSPGSYINISGKTYKKNSTVQVYMISSGGTATYIGSVTAGSTGKVKGKLQVPSGMTSGKYTLQLNGYTKSKNKVRSSNLGIEIAGASLGSLYFEADSSAATETMKAAVREIVSHLATGDKVVLFGFTAGSTAPRYKKANIALAKSRTATVKALFKAAGHPATVVLAPQGAEKGGHNKPNSRRVDVRKVN